MCNCKPVHINHFAGEVNYYSHGAVQQEILPKSQVCYCTHFNRRNKLKITLLKLIHFINGYNDTHDLLANLPMSHCECGACRKNITKSSSHFTSMSNTPCLLNSHIFQCILKHPLQSWLFGKIKTCKIGGVPLKLRRLLALVRL